ncbi:hypothetical protein J2P12_02245 [Candidatus Bathyarchaeota archaeon]|nr:hypothetical protein [Candidatus Bathyarchaeota archaeon]
MLNTTALISALRSDPNALPSTSTVVNNKAGLRFTLTLNKTSVVGGMPVDIIVDDQNILSTSNRLDASRNWRVAVEVFPCGYLGTIDPPIGFAIYRGYFTETSLWLANQLTLYSPGPYSCDPSVRGAMTSYIFDPNNDTAAFYGPCGSTPCSTTQVQLEEGFRGSWIVPPFNSSSGTFQIFTPGVYTVVGADQWGDLAILHFLVT